MKPADLILPLALLLLAGCQSIPPQAAPTLIALPIAPAVSSTSIRLPETVRAYTLGAYVDADDPNVRHAAHTIHRVERPGGWNLAAAANEKPALAPPVPLSAPTPRLEVLSAGKPVITPPPTAPEVAPPLPITPPTPPPSTRPSPPVADTAVDEPSALAPNADGLVDLTAPASELADDEINPFAVRANSVASPREVSLLVSGLVGGPTPGAVINGQALRVGDPVESLTLERVEVSTVLLRSGERRVRLPVAAKSFRVRLAP